MTLASVALHTSFHSVSLPDMKTDKDASQKSAATFSRMRAFSNPSPSLLKTLSAEIENLIVEANIRKDEVGPLRAAWEAALKRWRKSKSSSAKDEKEVNLKKDSPAAETSSDELDETPEIN